MCIARVEHGKDASSNNGELAYVLAEGEPESIGEDYCARLVVDGPWHVNIEVAVVFAGGEALNEGCPGCVRVVYCKREKKRKEKLAYILSRT
jgi:hypothetical protein